MDELETDQLSTEREKTAFRISCFCEEISLCARRPAREYALVPSAWYCTRQLPQRLHFISSNFTFPYVADTRSIIGVLDTPSSQSYSGAPNMTDEREAPSHPHGTYPLDKGLPQGVPDELPNQAQQLPCTRQTQPFFELPAEIRNAIYELAIPSKHRGDSLVITTPNWDELMVSAEQPAITRVSR